MKVKVTVAMFSVITVLLLFFTLAGPALTDGSPPSSTTPPPSAEPTYASAAYTREVKALRIRVIRVHRKLARVRSCFGQHRPNAVAYLPLRGAQLPEWQRAERRLRHQLKDWRGKYQDGRRRMLRPGGTSCGARWKPLMRWVGWPEVCLSQLSYIVMRESSGRERALNPSGAAGLLQLMPGWYRGGWGIPAGDPFDPEYNLHSGLRIYRKCGWSPWAL